MKKIIGITGGIASGKSYVCDIIEKQGFKIIDSDKISHELSKIGCPLYNAIIKEFGNDYLLDNKELNRKKLGALIFNNENEKLKLNSISHPLIINEINNQINEISDDLIFVDVPLLYESKMENLFNVIICVYVDRKTQIERLMNRDDISYDYALAKISSQMSLDEKAKLAHYVIDNSEDSAKAMTLKILKKLKGE